MGLVQGIVTSLGCRRRCCDCRDRFAILYACRLDLPLGGEARPCLGVAVGNKKLFIQRGPLVVATAQAGGQFDRLRSHVHIGNLAE